MKGDFPLLERIGDDERELDNAVVHALALGWEVFGPLLLAAIDSKADPDEVTTTRARVMRSITESQP